MIAGRNGSASTSRVQTFLVWPFKRHPRIAMHAESRLSNRRRRSRDGSSAAHPGAPRVRRCRSPCVVPSIPGRAQGHLHVQARGLAAMFTGPVGKGRHPLGVTTPFRPALRGMPRRVEGRKVGVRAEVAVFASRCRS